MSHHMTAALKGMHGSGENKKGEVDNLQLWAWGGLIDSGLNFQESSLNFTLGQNYGEWLRYRRGREERGEKTNFIIYLNRIEKLKNPKILLAIFRFTK